jgi:prepilin-type N-terminal cleavage/methylation domain-containing protein/prepilin-type processing-associated H-X9-DG protein
MRRRNAFTLVELLIVVGIIALLIAILMPTLNRAREQARRVQCASNLRQVAMATIMYANQNRGVLPGVGRWPQQRHDWVYWGRAAPYDALDDSGIAPYLGRPVTVNVLRCPSDDWEAREAGFKNMSGKPPAPYLFSYTLSRFMGNWGKERQRITQVRSSSQKIFFVEEDVRTMEDGMWLDEPVVVVTGRWADELNPWLPYWEPISARHELPRDADLIPANPFGSLAPARLFMSRRGNVAFVDGHVDYVSRRFTSEPRHVYPQDVP